MYVHDTNGNNNEETQFFVKIFKIRNLRNVQILKRSNNFWGGGYRLFFLETFPELTWMHLKNYMNDFV